MRIREIRVENFRSIRSLHLQMEALTVVIGSNGVGKTNLYRALSMLSAAASGQLARFVAQEGGMPSVLWAGARKKGVVRTSVGVSLESFDYTLSCGITPTVPSEPPYFSLDPEVKEEEVLALEGRALARILHRKETGAFARDAEGDRVAFPLVLWPSESVLSQVLEPQRFPGLSGVRNELNAWRFYHGFRTDPDSPLRQAQTGVRTPVLDAEGRDLAAALATIETIGDDRALARAVDDAFGGSRLEIQWDRGRFALAMHRPGLLRPLEARELSDGTLKYLCLLAALLAPRPAPLIALNEPEQSLHPQLMEPLARLLAAASERGQVWLTTHSEALASHLRALTGCRPIRLDMRDGETLIAGGAFGGRARPAEDAEAEE